MQNRLQVFDEATRPLVDYYRSRGLLHVVDANQSEEEVAERILAAIGYAHARLGLAVPSALPEGEPAPVGR